MANDELINSYKAARMLGCSVNDLFHEQQTRRGPHFELKRGKVRYHLSVIEEFIQLKFPPDAFYIGSVNLEETSAYAMDDSKMWRYKTSKAHAKLRKKARYFPGTKCENGHIDDRYVKNDKCLRCIADEDPPRGQLDQGRWQAVVRRLTTGSES